MKKMLIIFVVLSILLLGCINQNQNEKKVKIGLQATPSSALVIIADKEGFFKQEGLDVELVDFTAGKFALQAFLAKDLDFAIVGDVPVTLALMQGNDFYVLTQTVETTSENKVVVLKDGSLEDPQEYFLAKRRRLSTSIGGTPEFYTYSFLKYYNISISSIDIVAQSPQDMVSAITTRSVDAISIFEPYPYIAEEKLPNQTIRFSMPARVYSPLYVLVANKDLVNKHPEKAEAILRALVKAEEFIKKNPDQAQQIIANRTRFPLEEIKGIWGDYTINAVITDQLIKNWNSEAQWAIETNKTKGTAPDFEKVLRRDLLEKVR